MLNNIQFYLIRSTEVLHMYVQFQYAILYIICMYVSSFIYTLNLMF